MIISRKLTKNYAAELEAFLKYRKFKDGFTLIECQCSADWYKGDHCPRFTVALRLCNLTIFEFSIYNVNHVDDDLEYQTYQ